jgi:GNAT superfamily N-acetyltransferase
VLEVQRAAYAIEAELIGYPQLPPAHETLAALQGCGEELWLCEEDGELVGAVGLENVSDEEVLIARLFVAPSALRRGVGTEPEPGTESGVGRGAIRRRCQGRRGGDRAPAHPHPEDAGSGGERPRTAPDRWKPPGGGFQSWPRQDGQGYVP